MLDLSKLFNDSGNRFVAELRGNIRRQKDIKGRTFSYIAKATAMARQRAKGLGRGLAVRSVTGAKVNRVSKRTAGDLTELRSTFAVSLLRLMSTNKFHQNAFKFEASKDSVKVFVSSESYDSKVTYSDIVSYNNEGSADVNKNILKPPLIFPNNAHEVELMDAHRQTMDRFDMAVRSGEVRNMILEQGLKNVTLEIGI